MTRSRWQSIVPALAQQAWMGRRFGTSAHFNINTFSHTVGLGAAELVQAQGKDGT